MSTRRLSLMLSFMALPSLAACGDASPPSPPSASATSLAAIASKPGVSTERLGIAIDGLFGDEEAGQTQALVVLYRGRIVAERYADGVRQGTRVNGWSMTNTITGVMIGMLVSDGRLRLDETPPVALWQRSGDPRGEITVRQLLQMRAGLRNAELADPASNSDAVRMVFLDGRDDMAAYAESQPLEAEPGRKFEYSSASAVILADIAARSLTDSHDPAVRRRLVDDYLRTRLFEPVGMRSMVAEYDAAGTLIGAGMMHGTARDWGKFGEFLRHGGSVAGAQIIPRGWIEFMTRPSPRNPAYGAQLWLNRAASGDRGDMLFPGKAPAGLFACIGDRGQYVIVSPSQKLTIVRIGRTSDRGRAALRGRLVDLVALFPAS
jgi:CubicO group peptidase (beta-lactamase class C family)